MIRFPEGISRHDLDQWTRRGWFVRVDDNDTIVDIVSAVDIEQRELFVRSTSGNEYWCPVAELAVHWPHCGSINVGERVAVHLTRRQQRQWRRTYNSRQVNLMIPRKWDAMKLFDNVRDITLNSPELIEELFSPSYTPYDVAMRAISTGEAFSRALSPHIILAGNHSGVLCYYRGELVGDISSDNTMRLTGADFNMGRRLLKHFDGRVTIESN